MLWRRKMIEQLTPFVNREHYLATEVPQMRADIARYEILNKHGGLYLDCDMIWVRSPTCSASPKPPAAPPPSPSARAPP